MSLLKVAVIFTGGTISGASASPIDTTSYRAGLVDGETLLAQVPVVREFCEPVADPFLSVVSTDITNADLFSLRSRVLAHLADPQVAGVVITHGTSTMEETATFIHLTVETDKPVVFVGAMRPNTAISADGPMNLVQAMALAASPSARGRGVMICANDRICAAIYTSKTNSQAVDTFRALDMGYLGVMMGIQPVFYFPAVKPIAPPTVDVTGWTTLPSVAVVHEHLGDDDGVMRYFVERGAKGIVIAATGNASMSKQFSATGTALFNEGIAVVKSTITGSGYVWDQGKNPLIPAGFLNPQKSRLLLMLCLGAGLDLEAIRGRFLCHLG